MSDENKPAVPDAVIEDLNKFQPRNLKHVVCVERKSLPSLEGNISLLFFKILFFFNLNLN